MSALSFNVVRTSTPEVFDYFITPQQDPSTFAYIQNQFQNISSTILDSGRKFIEDSKTLFDQFYDSSIEKAARTAIRMAHNLSNPNQIQELTTLEDIQSAAPLMQRYIMAEPTIRAKFQAQECSGYAGSYMDTEPGFLNMDHYDWRRVNNHMLRFEGEGDQEVWVATAYYEDLLPGDRELEFDEKISISNTWDAIKNWMWEGQDPTCPFGSKLG